MTKKTDLKSVKARLQGKTVPVKKKKKKSSTGLTKTKVRTRDTTGDDLEDKSAPWDEDESSSAEDLIDKARKFGVDVRKYATDEDEDEFNDEAASKYSKGLRKVSKRVANNAKVYNSPATQEAVTRMSLASVLRLLPKAEAAYRSSTSEKSAYAYNALLNQVRELMADLRSMSSTDALADRVIMEAVNPAFMLLVNYVIEETSKIRGTLSTTNNPDTLRRAVNEKLTAMLTNIGPYGQEALEKAKDSARKSLRS